MPILALVKQYMQVAMVTILKNVTNLITAVGEMYLFRKRHTLRVWGSLFLMVRLVLCCPALLTQIGCSRLELCLAGFACCFDLPPSRFEA